MKENKVYIETYGCQMNVADTELIMGILKGHGYGLAKDLDEADVVLLNTCSIRDNGEKGIGVRLSKTETYDDIIPYREDGLSAWISVMRGCDKFCTFCVVPFTRGRERSRSLKSIIDEIKLLSDRGFREVSLLGQNVNSYLDGESDFADLLAASAKVDSTMRIRFTTSHPQDLSDKLLHTIAEHENI